MAALIPSASATGSGTMTLAGPSTNSNQTVTIPDATGTMMVSGNMPAFSAYASGNQSLTSATWTKILFDTEEFDTNSNFASSRFTPTVSGYYQINGVSNGGNSATITRSMVQIYKNGTGYKYGNDSSPTGTNGVAMVSSIVYFNGTTDYVEIYGLVTGTTPSTAGSSSLLYFNGAMVRAA
jgi:hypothetical protein